MHVPQTRFQEGKKIISTMPLYFGQGRWRKKETDFKQITIVPFFFSICFPFSAWFDDVDNIVLRIWGNFKLYNPLPTCENVPSGFCSSL